jgi:hypothetical protein
MAAPLKFVGKKKKKEERRNERRERGERNRAAAVAVDAAAAGRPVGRAGGDREGGEGWSSFSVGGSVSE